jgi:hypothetical protein
LELEMALSHSPKIITENIGFNVDFANPKSINGTTLTDISLNRLPITLTNPEANSLTITGGYAQFTPVDVANTATFYTISNSYFNDIKNEMTLETCMYVTNDFGSGAFPRGVSPRITESGSPLGFAINSSGISFEINTSAGWKTGSASSINSGYNKWVYVTQTTSLSGDAFKTYINGVLVGQLSLGADTIGSGNGILIGRGFFGGVKNYHGRVGFVRVYNRALSATEIQQNFNALRGRYGL